MIQCACIVNDTTFSLVFENLAEPFHEAATDLAFGRIGNDFRRTFSVQGNDVSAICQNFRRHGELLLLQTARVQPVPWKKALRLWLERLSRQPIHWWLGGSAALAVRGINVEPRDFDIITDDVGAERLGILFREALIEPVVPVQGWMCNWFGRAFLEARFEWVGGVDERADTPYVSDYGPIASQRLETIIWEEYQIPVPPIDLQLAVCERRGLSERIAHIKRYLDSQPST